MAAFAGSSAAQQRAPATNEAPDEPTNETQNRTPIAHEYVDFRDRRGAEERAVDDARRTLPSGTSPGDAPTRASATDGSREADSAEPQPRSSAPQRHERATERDASDQHAAGALSMPRRITLDAATDSASGTTYEDLYSPTVRPFKRSQVLDRVIVEDGVIALTERSASVAPSEPTDTAPATAWIRRRASIVIPRANRWYRLPTTSPTMRIERIESSEPLLAETVEWRRTRTGLYDIRFVADNSAPPRPLTLHTAEDPIYGHALTPDENPAPSRDYRTLPTGLLREVGRVAPALALPGTSPEHRRAIVQSLTAYFRSFETEPLRDEDSDQSLFFRIVTQKTGVCRHRAFAFVAIAQALGIEARFVANELHAFAEVQLTDGTWRRLDLGGLVLPGEGEPAPRPASVADDEAPIVHAHAGDDSLVGSDDAGNVNAAPEDVATGDARPVSWTLDRRVAYRGDRLRVRGVIEDGPRVGEVTVRVHSDSGRAIARTTTSARDGSWELDLTLDGRWDTGPLRIDASFVPAP